MFYVSIWLTIICCVARREGVVKATSFSGLRLGPRTVVVVLGDGVSNREASQVQSEVKILEDADVPIFVIGAGRKVDPAKLKEISSDPDDEYFFMISKFRNLIISVNQYVLKFCENDLPTGKCTSDLPLFIQWLSILS